MANLKVYLSGILVRIEIASTPSISYLYAPCLLRYEAIYVPALLKYVIYIYAQRFVDGNIIQEVVNGAPFDEISDSSNTPYSLIDYNVVLAALQSLGIVVSSVPATETTLQLIATSIGMPLDTPAMDTTSAWSLVALLKGCWFYLKSIFGRQTDGTQRSQLYGAAKGATTAGDATTTNAGANRQPLDVIWRDDTGTAVTNIQYANGSAQATPTGTAILGWDGTNVRALSTNNAGVLNVRLSDGVAILQGQQAMATSIPVVIAGNQTSLPVSITEKTHSWNTDLGISVAKNIKATPGRVYSFTCYNDSNQSRYFQLHNVAGVPTVGAAPAHVWLIPPKGQIVIGNDYFHADGTVFSTGLAWGFSTTRNTYTAGTNTDQTTIISFI